MFFRLIGLVVLALLSMPVLSFATGNISAPNDMQVVAGIVTILGLIIAWYFVGCNYLNYFKKRFSELPSQMSGGGPKTRHLVIIMLLIGGIGSTACGRTLVEPGHVGIQVDYYGQDRGVESYPKVTGVVWYNPFTKSVLQYPTFVQTAVWTQNTNEGKPVNEEITFTTSDQMKVDADISLAYHLVPDKVPAFYVKFRSDDLAHFTHGFLRNLAREKFDNVAGKYKIEQIMGDNAPFLSDTREMLQKDLDPIGVQLDQFGFIGAPRPPPAVTESINMKVKATQDAIRVENEVRQTKAQAEKDVAQAEGQARAAIAKADGEAKANVRVASSITPTLLEWRRLDIQQQSISRWNGALPIYNGGGTLPLIQLPPPKQ